MILRLLLAAYCRWARGGEVVLGSFLHHFVARESSHWFNKKTLLLFFVAPPTWIIILLSAAYFSKLSIQLLCLSHQYEIK
jgi:hypothetical protein